MPRLLRSLLPLLVALLALTASAALAAAPLGSCRHGYSYAGLLSETNYYGISAAVTAGPARVENNNGHVAAYVNVGTTARWLQLGVNTPDTSQGQTQAVYLEEGGRGQSHYTPLGTVLPGQAVRLQLVMVLSQPGYWQPSVNGLASGAPIYLGSSSKGLLVSSAAESYLVADDGVCNSFQYRFDDVRVVAAAGAAFTPARSLFSVQDPGNDLQRLGRKSVTIVASGTRGPAPTTTPTTTP